MSMLNEFKKFALRGNVIDMAVGIIIGGAFGALVKSLVDDVIMPPIGMVTGGINFRDLAVTLKRNADGTAAVSLNYGAFINNVITFLIVAWAVFILVKAMNVAQEKLHFGEALKPDAPAPPEDVLLLREIRDELKKSK